MKFLPLCLLSCLVATPAVASNYESLMNKLDMQISELQATNEGTSDKAVTIPWETVDRREQQLWQSITSGYEYLRSFHMSERYEFIFSGMKANAVNFNQRAPALKSWLDQQNKIIKAKRINKQFYQQWDSHVNAMNAAITELAKPRPEIKVTSGDSELRNQQLVFISNVKEELQSIEAAQKLNEQTAAATTQTHNSTPTLEASPSKPEDQTHYYLASALALLAFALGLAKGKKGKKQKRKAPVAKPTATVAAPLITPLATEPPPLMMKKFDADLEVVSLEEECRKIIEENQHLLKLAEINIYPSNRSPFNTSITAPAKNVQEALNWLLKGTLAIANTHGSKISHMEWKCHENGGRVSLDFTLHGLECDYKALYLNTLLEGDGSAPAHFGRSEMALEEHAASVLFKKGNKKTTVTLGLESQVHNLSH